jgi:DNA-binding CsgD family transcriptional regulator
VDLRVEEVLGKLAWQDGLSIKLASVMIDFAGDIMPKRRKRLSREDTHQRDLEIVRLKLAGMTGLAIARKYRISSGRITQILHRVAAKLAPRTFKG